MKYRSEVVVLAVVVFAVIVGLGTHSLMERRPQHSGKPAAALPPHGRPIAHVVITQEFDDEHWSGTPLQEQQNPFTYVQLAEKLVHSHGLLFSRPGRPMPRQSSCWA
jgi:hypothetical protein